MGYRWWAVFPDENASGGAQRDGSKLTWWIGWRVIYAWHPARPSRSEPNALAAHTRSGICRLAESHATVTVTPSRYVLLSLGHTLTGYTVKAMERKIERGDWIEGREWKRAPDGHILLDLEGYRRWVERQY